MISKFSPHSLNISTIVICGFVLGDIHDSYYAIWVRPYLLLIIHHFVATRKLTMTRLETGGGAGSLHKKPGVSSKVDTVDHEIPTVLSGLCGNQ